MSEKIRVAGMVNDSIVDGTGLRFTVFLQGCPFDCLGCQNQNTHSFDGGTLYTPEDIFEKIIKNPLLDGVTFSGGEPLCQASALIELAKLIKSQNLNLAIYSGFVFENLISEKAPKDALKLLQYADELIDGPFILSLKSLDLNFKGSSNQRVLDIQKSLKEKKAILLADPNWN